MAKRTLDLLDSLLEDRQMSADQLNSLLSDQVTEDQFLDYKDGRILASNAVSKMLRKYMSGFANAEGGVLIVQRKLTRDHFVVRLHRLLKHLAQGGKESSTAIGRDSLQ